MLSAIRRSDNQTVIAKSQIKADGPFLCIECKSAVILRSGSVRMAHFSHSRQDGCQYARGESEMHRRCKLEIYDALKMIPGIREVALERSFGTVRPDVSAFINGARVAIEVQISTLSPETIRQRTEEYARNLSLLPMHPQSGKLQ
jgi:competence protein CoiA